MHYLVGPWLKLEALYTYIPPVRCCLGCTSLSLIRCYILNWKMVGKHPSANLTESLARRADIPEVYNQYLSHNSASLREPIFKAVVQIRSIGGPCHDAFHTEVNLIQVRMRSKATVGIPHLHR